MALGKEIEGGGFSLHMISAKQGWKFIQLQIVPALAKMESELDQIWCYYDISQPVLAEKLEALPRWNQNGEKPQREVLGFLKMSSIRIRTM